MGGFDFEWNGKVYDICTEGGVPFFSSDEEREAFEQWRVTEEGINFFGPVPTDWSKEHYLDDRYPWNREKGRRIDVDDPDAEEDPYINWYDYVECEFGCKKHFYITKDIHVCSYCNGPACKKCAEKKFLKCSSDGCEKWNCGGRGVVAPPSVNGNWRHYQSCNGGRKKKCHDCNKECAHCGKANAAAKKCSRCHFSFYCNKECQKADFKFHKKSVCKAVASQTEMERMRHMTRMMNMYE